MKKTAIIMLVLISVSLGSVLTAQNGWGYGNGGGFDDNDGFSGYGDGDGGNEDWFENNLAQNPAAQQQFLTANPGVNTFIETKKAVGATILEAGLDWVWGTGQVGEVVVSEANVITVYYVNKDTGEVLSQHNAPVPAW